MTFHPMHRRNFLTGVAAGIGAVWLGANWPALRNASAAAARVKPGDPFRVLSPSEASVLEALADQIIPTDDTPGAREAQVVRFMDQALATFAADQRHIFTRGLAALQVEVHRRLPSATSFATLEPGVQLELMNVLQTVDFEFFETVRVGTICGMFADPSYGGNFEKAGWKLIGFEDRFTWQPPFGDYDRE
jgi:gluconate 2-dehydrogenase gamma chain